MTAKAAPRIAVIMPAYNAERYIENTINSLLAQSFENFELLVVNDGSKDSTAERISALAEKDSRVKLFTVENGGPAKARNFALSKVAEGTEFIMFMDADDVYTPDALKTAAAAAENGADMVLFGFTIRNADGTTNDYCEPRMSLSREDFGAALVTLYKANLLNQVWAKLFRAELIQKNNIRFPDYRWGEDRLFIYDCLERAARVEVVPDCNYIYIMHEGESLITRFYDRKLDICFESDARMQELCRGFSAPADGYFGYMFIKMILSCMSNLFAPSCGLTHKEKLAYVKNIVTDERVLARGRNISGGAAVKILAALMRTKIAWLNLFAARMMTLVGRVAPKLFLKLKHRK